MSREIEAAKADDVLQKGLPPKRGCGGVSLGATAKSLATVITSDGGLFNLFTMHTASIIWD